MIKAYERGKKIRLSEHFYSTEFDCRCKYKDCVITLIDDDLVEADELLRAIIGPLIITSGFRCMRHNHDVGGEQLSFHIRGMANDLQTPDIKPGIVIATAANKVERFRNGGMGIALRWIHVDTRVGFTRWTY